MNFDDAAALYVSLGWKVFALQEGSKEPWPNSRAVLDATDDHATIEGWARRNPRSNIAIACGASGLMVVDLDPRNGCWDTLARWEQSRRVFPMTVHSRTRSGGLHLFFSLPNGLPTGWRRKLPGGVDIQVGNKYVVGAPSVIYPHLAKDGQGGAYEWVRAPVGSNLPSPPRWLMDMLKPDEARPGKPMASTPSGANLAERRLHGAARKVASCVKGGRNDELNKQAHLVGRMIARGDISEDLAVAKLTEAAVACGLDPVETRKTIRSGINAGKLHHGSGKD